MNPAPTRHASIESAWLVDRYVLFDDRDGVVHELSPSASAVWDLVDGHRSASAIAAELTERFGQDLSVDVQAALADFRDRRLLNDSGGALA